MLLMTMCFFLMDAGKWAWDEELGIRLAVAGGCLQQWHRTPEAALLHPSLCVLLAKLQKMLQSLS